MQVLIVYNAPTLPEDDPDAASEAGVLESVEAVEAALQAAGHAVERLGMLDSIEPLAAIARRQEPPAAAVNFCEGFAGDPGLEAQVAALFELLRLPYTGASAETLWLTRDKARTKFLLSAAGLPAPAGLKVRAHASELDAERIVRRLGTGPWFVKPAAQDASLGIGPESVVTEAESLATRIAAVGERYGDVLVEPYLAGREFNVSVVDCAGGGSVGSPRVLPLAEVCFTPDLARKWPIVTYDAKWSPASSDWNSTPVACPADVDSALGERLRTIAAATFLELGCRDYARVDFRVDAAGNPWILEVNANPDLSPGAGFARSLLAGGIAYAEFSEQLILAASKRR